MLASTLPPSPPSVRQRLRWLIFATFVLLTSVVGWALWSRWHPNPSELQTDSADPRLTYTGPYRNIHPEVAYVGDAACRACHPDIAASYAHHPMGRSLAPIQDALTRPVQNAHFEALGALFQGQQQGNTVRHQMTILDRESKPIDSLHFDVGYVIGSGTRGHSYLAYHDGRLVQTPISWFSQKGFWNLSPGFDAAMARGRPITADCLYCHANRTQHVEDTLNSYHNPPFLGHAIGCERCHGPGELHVRERSQGRSPEGLFDPTIVNPARLSHELREAVCQQCHLAGEVRVPRLGRQREEYRPGLPLDDFFNILVSDRQEGHRKAVNHVEQMLLSRCSQKSQPDKPLGCTSCHDPHRTPTPQERLSFFRDRCLQCHHDRGCSLPSETRLRESPQNNCIHCHMPRYSASDIPHVAGTDHRIVRRPDPLVTSEPDTRPPVVFGSHKDLDTPSLRRARGIGLAKLAANHKGDPPAFARLALDLLGTSEPVVGDPLALEARAQALLVLGRKEQALDLFDQVLQQAPRRESTLHAAALLAQNLGQRDRTLDYWRRVVQINPDSADYRANLATMLAFVRQWEEAHEHARAWVRLDPASRPARELWIRCLHQKGDRDTARTQEDILKRLP